MAPSVSPSHSGPRPCEWSGPLAPLSSGQRRLWFLTQADPHNPAYNLTVALRIHGELDFERLRAALYRVVERHEPLRTVFRESAGVPYQEVRESGQVPLEVIHLTDRQGAPEEALQRRLGELARAPIDISRDVMKAALIRVAADDHVLSVSLHHMVADGWSAKVFVRDIECFYRGADDELPPLEVTPRDHAVWEREHVATPFSGESDRFWEKHLTGAPAESRIPAPFPEGDDSWEGARFGFDLPERTYARIKELARSEDCRPFAFLVAAVQILVHRLSTQDDVVIAAPMANRRHPQTHNLVGMFVNTVPLRATFAADTTFREHLRSVRSTVEHAKRHQHVPFDRILDRAGVARGDTSSPLCQVMLNLLGTPLPTPRFAGLETSLLGQIDTGAAQYDLALHLETPRGEGIRGWFEYRKSRFDEEWVRLLGDRLTTLIESVLDDPDRAVGRHDLLPARERRLLAELNDTAGRSHAPRRLQDFILSQAELRPEAPAVRDETEEVSYGELLERAHAVAGRLRSCGVGPDTVVGVCADRSVHLVTAILGILLADGCYLPLDPAHPPRRLRFVLDEADVRTVLAEGAYRKLITSLEGDRSVLPLDARGAAPAAERPRAEPGDADLAYVIYTSGSTGKPKGVGVPHRGIVNRLVWMQARYRLSCDDVVLQKTPYTFDVSVWEFFWPLMYGAQLVMARSGAHVDPHYLADVIRRESVTTVHFVPSMLAVFLEEPSLPSCTSLRRVICSGEALTAALADRFRRCNGAELHNLYGPTEASVDVTAWECRETEPGPVVPIGRPITNVTAYVLDGHGGQVPIGSPGELHVGGMGLARGYIGRPDLTRERFIPDPFSADRGARLYRTGDLARWTAEGYLEFLGRLDHQVKLNGLRIELGEIEAALLEHPAVSEAAALLRDDLGASQKIVAYVVSSADPPAGEDDLRAHLVQRLPEYMIPSRLVALTGMPLGDSGKLDRKALPVPTRTPGRGNHAGVARAEAPRDEETLAEVWSEVLGVPREAITADSGFFELGGDSILTIRLRSLLRRQGFDIDVRDALRHQRLEDMATRLVADRGHDAEAKAAAALPQLPSLPEGVVDAYPLSALQAGMIFHSEFNEYSAVYQVSFDIHLRLRFEPELFQDCVDSLVERHEILRTRFDLGREEGAFQCVQASAHLPVWVEDLRGGDEEAQQERVAEVFAEERSRPFDTASAPLLRLGVIRRTDDAINLFVSFHDAVFDGWSAATFLTELFEHYLDALAGRAPAREDPRVRYRDFVAEEQAALEASEIGDYWLDHLEGARFCALPRPRLANPGQVGRSIDLPVSVPGALVQQVHRLASRIAVTPKSVLLSAHLATLARMTDTTDVMTGLVSGGRPELDGAERLLGQFLNTLPFRVEAEGTWEELISRVFQQEADHFPHRRLPLARIQRMHGGRPLFETAFNYIHFHVYERISGRDWEFLSGRFTDPFHFPLTVNARVDPLTEELAIVVNYNDAELDEIQAHTFATDMIAALQEMTSTPRDSCGPWIGASAESASAGERIVTEPAHAARALISGSGRDDASLTPVERDLVGIWEGVLGATDIGLDDDFFELGGDSILSIQICARARRLGHPLRPRQVFNHPTVRELAEHAASEQDAAAARRTVGEVPAAPAQRLVLTGTADRVWDNVSLVLRCDEPLEARLLVDAAAAVVDRHESLRSVLKQDVGGAWWQEAAAPPPADALVRFGSSDRATWLEGLQTSLDPASGAVVRFGQYTDDDEVWLALVAHHAVADARSLQIVAADLLSAYTVAAEGVAPVLDPAVPLERMYRDTEATVADREDWRGLLDTGVVRVAVDGAEPGLQSEERETFRDADPEQTALLLERARELRVHPSHLLMLAVGDALQERLERGSAVCDVMTSGRDLPSCDPDIDEAVGCLAAPQPVVLPEGGRTAARAKRVRDSLAAPVAPRSAYLELRLAGTDPDALPDLLFNYVGRLDAPLTPPITGVELDTAGQRGPRRPRPYRFEIVALIYGGRLRLRFLHPAGLSDDAGLAALADGVVPALAKLLHEREGHTSAVPGDFPHSGLSQEELDNLMRQLAGGHES